MALKKVPYETKSVFDVRASKSYIIRDSVVVGWGGREEGEATYNSS